MATTSSISVFNPETNLWHSVYCHFDGYLSHNGKILFEHYTTLASALKLVSEGDMSVLAPSCDKPDGHTFDDPVKGYCIYYGRDRGENKPNNGLVKKLISVCLQNLDKITTIGSKMEIGIVWNIKMVKLHFLKNVSILLKIK